MLCAMGLACAVCRLSATRRLMPRLKSEQTQASMQVRVMQLLTLLRLMDHS